MVSNQTARCEECADWRNCLGDVCSTGEDEEDGAGNADGAGKKKRREHAPAATLENSFEALNAKAIDESFVVDPLFTKTSAMFDEGGAKASEHI